MILVGQSQGASTIWAYVAQFGTARLKAVVSVDQSPKMINEGDWQDGMYGLDTQTRPTFFASPLPAPNRQPLDPGLTAFLAAHAGEVPAFDMALALPLLFDHADADWRDAIAATDVPALFIAGGESPFWPPQHAVDMAALAPKGSFSIVEGSGHAVNWEFSDAFNAILLDYIRSL